MTLLRIKGFSDGSGVKNLPAKAGDTDSIPGAGRSTGEGNANSLQYSCPGNPTDRGAWQATVYEVAESDMTEHYHKFRPQSSLMDQRWGR